MNQKQTATTLATRRVHVSITFTDALGDGQEFVPAAVLGGSLIRFAGYHMSLSAVLEFLRYVQQLFENTCTVVCSRLMAALKTRQSRLSLRPLRRWPSMALSRLVLTLKGP